ncbi:MAG: FAD binding domain-containing protein [Ignavibacteria bacterium]
MESKIRFILNKESIETMINPAIVVLDHIRTLRLTGTKEGCKEGDCGACTVLVGELNIGEVIYRSVNSCLIPLNNINGKHIVTIEGLNHDEKFLNPIQKFFAEEGASQCGFCTPGFIVSLTGHFLNNAELKFNNVIDSLDGNICRCTGHNSIIRAAERITETFKEGLSNNGTRLKFLTDNRIVPEYFNTIRERLEKIQPIETEHENSETKFNFYIGGGTDLFVQRPDEMLNTNVRYMENNKSLTGINIRDGFCHIGSSTTVTDLMESAIINKIFPDITRFAELFGSTPIRNSATVGGNLNNASPIGDMTAFFMALNSVVRLTDGKNKRDVELNKFYKSYKVTERLPGEYMESIYFRIPEGKYFLNFEKVSKRTYLDIASVNTGILISISNAIITDANISAGGVSATPLYLQKTSAFLKGKELSSGIINEAVSISQTEISPITDARGTAEYKSLLLSRLIFTHFITLFPEIINVEETI